MPKTIEQIFEETSVKFRQQMIDAVEGAIEGVYEDYLPHVENDTCFNVRQQSITWLERFLADDLREEDFKIDPMAFDSKAIRQKMFKDNQVELILHINKDMLERLEELEKRYAHDWEFKYG